MATRIQFLFSAVILLLIMGCNKDYSLEKSDFELIPYKGNEILILHSNNSEIDTLHLNNYTQHFISAHTLSLFGSDKYEIYGLNAKVYDPEFNRYLEENSIIELTSTSEGLSISFNIPIKDKTAIGYFTFQEFKNIPKTKLTLEHKTYDDVKVINYKGIYEKDGYFAERFYWSDAFGLLGIDTKNQQWRVQNIDIR